MSLDNLDIENTNPDYWEKILSGEGLQDTVVNQLEAFPPHLEDILDFSEAEELNRLLNQLDVTGEFDILSDFQLAQDGNGLMESKVIGSKNNYILLKNSGNQLHIDYLEVPGNGIKSLLFILKYAIINSYNGLSLEPRTTKEKQFSLEKFYQNFGFTKSSSGYMHLMFTNENIQILIEKIKIYIESKEWK